MFNINEKRIEQLLTYLEQEIFPLLSELKQHSLSNPVDRKAAERILHIIIEAITDIGNQIIDGFVMRDPGSLLDIITILEDEKVIDQEMVSLLNELIPFRKTFMQDYYLEQKDLSTIFNKVADNFPNYPSLIRNYLKKELREFKRS